jgi:poly(A) polymerase
LEHDTAEAVRQMASEILVVSQERIAQELQKILAHPSRRVALERAITLGVLPVIVPELTRFVAEVKLGTDLPRNVANWLRSMESLPSPDFELALAALLRPGGEGRTRSESRRLAETVCRRLKLSNSQVEQTGWLLEQEGQVQGLPQARASIQKRLLAHPWSRNLVALARAFALGEEVPTTAAAWCDQYLDQTPKEVLQPVPLLTGDDLKRLQLVPGKEFKTILEAVYDAQLEGRVTTRDEAQALAWVWWTRLRGGVANESGKGADLE